MLASDLVYQVEQYLNQSAAMLVQGLPDGQTENSYVISPETQMLLWLTEGTNRIVRLTLPILDVVTFTPSVAGQPTIGPYSTLLNSAMRQLHTPSQVAIGDNALTAANIGFMNSPANWYPPTPQGNPTAWADNRSGIALSSYTATPTFTISGYFLPAPLLSDQQQIDFAIDDFTGRTIAYYTAWMIAGKQLDNLTLANRLMPCANEWVGGVKEMYSRLIQADSTLGAFFPPAPIDSLLQVVKQIVPRN